MEYKIIVACTEEGGIGYKNAIPWNIPADISHFKEITTKTQLYCNINAVIMGRKTWESIPVNIRPLKDRINIIISNTLRNSDVNGAIVINSLDDAHSFIKTNRYIETVFVIGGEQIYREALYDHRYTTIYLTVVKKKYTCDKFFPIKSLISRYKAVKEIKFENYSFIELIQDD